MITTLTYAIQLMVIVMLFFMLFAVSTGNQDWHVVAWVFGTCVPAIAVLTLFLVK